MPPRPPPRRPPTRSPGDSRGSGDSPGSGDGATGGGASGPASAADDGARLTAQAARLGLLVRHLAGRAILARVDADDLVQEVYLRALSAPHGLPEREPGDGALFRFLVRLARNTVVDVARALRAAKRQGRETRLERSDWSRAGAAHPAARGPGPVTHAQGAETEERLAAAWQKLSPEHRRVIGLRQLEGLSAEQAGARMGRSAAAVHSLYRRALEAWEGAAS
jgi:RNA polymerase sigma-70 factor (ECF subfamily)